MFHIPAHKNVAHPAGQVSGAPTKPLLNVRLGHCGPIVEIIDVPAPAPKLFDTCSFVMAFEAGELDEDEIVEGFQHLINSGVVWSLQGSYGRTAAALIESGRCEAAAR